MAYRLAILVYTGVNNKETLPQQGERQGLTPEVVHLCVVVKPYISYAYTSSVPPFLPPFL